MSNRERVSHLRLQLLQRCCTALAAVLTLLLALTTNANASSSSGQRPKPFVNASVQAAVVPGSGAAGFRISNSAAGNYTAFTVDQSGHFLPVSANLPYVFSVAVEGGTPTSQEIRVEIEWRNAAGHADGTSLGYPVNKTYIISSGTSAGPQQVIVYGKSPPDAASALPIIAVTGSTPAGSAIFVQDPYFRLTTDGVSFVQAPSSVPPLWPSYRYDPFGAWLACFPLREFVPAQNMPVVHSQNMPAVAHAATTSTEPNPFTIAGGGLESYNSFVCKQSQSGLSVAISDANWLVENQQADGRWLYEFGDPLYDIQPPWTSTIAQGAGISLLVRIWQHTGDSQYLEAAERALLPFSRPVASGGVLDMWGNNWFYQEAPNASLPSFILNGFMYSLIGLYDLSVAAPDSNADTLYQRGWNSLVAMLPYYDNGIGSSTYDIRYLTQGVAKKPADANYNGAEVALLTAINSVSPSPVLRFFRQRWSEPNQL